MKNEKPISKLRVGVTAVIALAVIIIAAIHPSSLVGILLFSFPGVVVYFSGAKRWGWGWLWMDA